MKVAKQILDIGNGGLDLHIEGYLGDKKVIDQQGKSLTYGFINFLASKFKGKNIQTNTKIIEKQFTVAAATNATPIRITTSSSHGLSTGDWVYIWGGLGNTAVNGYHQVTSVNSTTLDLDGTTGNGTYTASSASCYTVDDAGLINVMSNDATGSVVGGTSTILKGIVVGGGNTAVAMTDSYLETPRTNGTGLNQLQIGATTVDLPVINGNDIYVNMVRTFGNGSSASITVSEVGLMAEANYGYYMMLARDVIDTITIPVGVTLTMNYRIKATLGANGGLVNNFFLMLHGILNNTSVSISDIGNTTRTSLARASSLRLAVGGGDGYANLRDSYDTSDNYGLVIGTGDATPSTGDIALNAKIAEGITTGTLKHYGVHVSDVYYETTHGSVFISRIFENVSGGDIIIAECGLFANGSNSPYPNGYERSICIARNLLETPLTLANGEYGKIEYEIRAAL